MTPAKVIFLQQRLSDGREGETASRISLIRKNKAEMGGSL
jgi:hypothetical protein